MLTGEVMYSDCIHVAFSRVLLSDVSAKVKATVDKMKR